MINAWQRLLAEAHERFRRADKSEDPRREEITATQECVAALIEAAREGGAPPEMLWLPIRLQAALDDLTNARTDRLLHALPGHAGGSGKTSAKSLFDASAAACLTFLKEQGRENASASAEIVARLSGHELGSLISAEKRIRTYLPEAAERRVYDDMLMALRLATLLPVASVKALLKSQRGIFENSSVDPRPLNRKVRHLQRRKGEGT